MDRRRHCSPGGAVLPVRGTDHAERRASATPRPTGGTSRGGERPRAAARCRPEPGGGELPGAAAAAGGEGAAREGCGAGRPASRRVVSAGDSVVPGQVIALSGSSGRSTAPQLHFEIRREGKTLDPLTVVKQEN